MYKKISLSLIGLVVLVFARIGYGAALPDVNVSKIGSQEWLKEQYGMSTMGIADTIEKTVRQK